MMGTLLDRFRGFKSFPRGIHPPHRKKLSEPRPIELFIPKGPLQVPMVLHFDRLAACMALDWIRRYLLIRHPL